MEQRRLILFVTLSTAVLIGWLQFVVPVLYPVPPKPQAAGAQKPAVRPDDEQPEKAADAADLAQSTDEGADANELNASGPSDLPTIAGEAPPVVDDHPSDTSPDKPSAPVQAEPPPEFPPKEVLLGSLNPDDGFFMQVSLTARGAAVAGIQLNDPRYRDLNHPDTPLKLVGSDPQTDLESFVLSVPEVDEQLSRFGTDLTRINWELISDPTSRTEAVFRFESTDGALEIRKRYELQKGDAQHRDEDPSGYLLHAELTFHNLGTRQGSWKYSYQGPVGLPLENAENTRKYRDIKVGFLDDEGNVKSQTVRAASIVDAADKNKLEEWKRAVKYIGVDIQYFAVLMLPGGDQLKSPYLEKSKPVLISKQANKHDSDVSVLLTSRELDLAAGEEVSHSYTVFAGPKRGKLLDKVGAPGTMDFGWFGKISKGMLALLNFFHVYLHVPYGLAIIFLTLMVRACLFPLSLKQTAGAKKMKELQPKIAELKKKYAKDKEKFARAQMELFSKHNYNPLSGCLPVVLQFPVFIGLYQALYNAVDLRMAPFLWVKNLAAPDALFRMPFSLPFLGSNFNLLPCITIALFILNQKMFMPPATDKDQEFQQKMMKYMMLLMGFMFYRVPAGLCMYFISSSAFGMLERKVLDFTQSTTTPIEGNEGPAPPKNPKKSFFHTVWERLAASADITATARNTANNGTTVAAKKSAKKKKSQPPRR